MRKDLTNREPVNCAVNKELNQKLIQLSRNTGIPKSKLLDNAIKLYLENNAIWALVLITVMKLYFLLKLNYALLTQI